MKQFTLILIIMTFAYRQANGQLDTSGIYKGLETRKYYLVDLQSLIQDGKAIYYKVNGKIVSKSTFDKFESTNKNMDGCCPCILKKYDVNDVLIREVVSCTDCGVGWFRYYYPNGKVSLSGQYKENPSGNWKGIWSRGFCSVLNGQWTYFSEEGDTLYSEYWNNGKFIKQLPEQ
jgi:antitoxin component YwqK of YwqJK toxin-antitoxin module